MSQPFLGFEATDLYYELNGSRRLRIPNLMVRVDLDKALGTVDADGKWLGEFHFDDLPVRRSIRDKQFRTLEFEGLPVSTMDRHLAPTSFEANLKLRLDARSFRGYERQAGHFVNISFEAIIPAEHNPGGCFVQHWGVLELEFKCDEGRSLLLPRHFAEGWALDIRTESDFGQMSECA